MINHLFQLELVRIIKIPPSRNARIVGTLLFFESKAMCSNGCEFLDRKSQLKRNFKKAVHCFQEVVLFLHYLQINHVSDSLLDCIDLLVFISGLAYIPRCWNSRSTNRSWLFKTFGTHVVYGNIYRVVQSIQVAVVKSDVGPRCPLVQGYLMSFLLTCLPVWQ